MIASGDYMRNRRNDPPCSFCPSVVHTIRVERAIVVSLVGFSEYSVFFPTPGPYKGWLLSTVNAADDGSYLYTAKPVISYTGNKCPCCVQ